MGHRMLLTEFYFDRHLLPQQQNLRQNGLLDDVSRSPSQPTLISR